MYDWFIRVKDNEFDRFILRDIVLNKTDKKEVKEYLLEEYSEILSCIREKMTSKTPENERRYTTFIIKLDTYWKKFWLEEIKCEQCERTYTRIELNKYSNNSDSRFCSTECKNRYEKQEKELKDYFVDKYGEYDAYIYKIVQFAPQKNEHLESLIFSTFPLQIFSFPYYISFLLKISTIIFYLLLKVCK